MATKIQPSTGNVFTDLGFSEEKAHELTKIIEARGLTQRAAADLLKTTQPRISDLVLGKIDQFRVDSLLEMLRQAGT